MSIMPNRGLLVSVGVATATVTSFAGFAPAVVSTAGAVDGTDGANTATVEPTADGTYESCSAYFGYGKIDPPEDDGIDFGALDLTTFPVTVQGGVPAGAAPTVENGGIDVVLVLTDIDEAELRCVPEQVTESQWNATWGDVPVEGLNIPSWPGPGHYPYPTLPPPDFAPVAAGDELLLLGASPAAIGDLNDLASVGFEVVGGPEGYTLVDPTQTQSFPSTFFDTLIELLFFEIVPTGQLPAPLVEVIEAAVGPAGVTAYSATVDFCLGLSSFEDPVVEPIPPLPNGNDPDLVAAVQALWDYVFVPDVPGRPVAPITCDDVGTVFGGAGIVIFVVNATIENESPITISLPVAPAPPAPPPAPPAARAAQVTPAFTG